MSAVVAGSLWVLLTRTRLGIAMRAVVDDRNLARLNGENPDVASVAGWVVGSMLAALAGVLIAPILALDVARLTLLVINAYAVAIVGRLRSLPLTALGAVILGLSVSYFDWGLSKMHHVPVVVQSIHDSLPIIMLFVVLLVLPQDRIRFSATLRSRDRAPVPSMRRAVAAGIAFVLAAWFAEGLIHGALLRAVGQGLALAIVMLSLVVLVGYAGQISLAQLAFGGLGALAASWLPGQSGASPVGLVLAAAFAGLVGAIVALPCLRLRDLYLALGTMAFALLVEQNVLGQINRIRDRQQGVRPVEPARERQGVLRRDRDGVRAAGVADDRAAARRVRAPAAGDEGQPGRVHDAGARPDPHEGGGVRAWRRRSPGSAGSSLRAGRARSARTTSACSAAPSPRCHCSCSRWSAVSRWRPAPSSGRCCWSPCRRWPPPTRRSTT